MTYQSEYEVQEKIRVINRELKWLKESFKPSDSNPCGGHGTVADRMNNLRHDRRVLQDIKAKIKQERDYELARREALDNIFRKYNNDIYPSDVGQEWSWRVEGDEVICIISGNEFREKLKLS